MNDNTQYRITIGIFYSNMTMKLNKRHNGQNMPAGRIKVRMSKDKTTLLVITLLISTISCLDINYYKKANTGFTSSSRQAGEVSMTSWQADNLYKTNHQAESHVISSHAGPTKNWGGNYRNFIRKSEFEPIRNVSKTKFDPISFVRNVRKTKIEPISFWRQNTDNVATLSQSLIQCPIWSLRLILCSLCPKHRSRNYELEDSTHHQRYGINRAAKGGKIGAKRKFNKKYTRKYDRTQIPSPPPPPRESTRPQ